MPFLLYNLPLDFARQFSHLISGDECWTVMVCNGKGVFMKAVQHDMTSGNPMRIILNFTLPIFIGNVFQQFYNMADAVIVGKFVGTKALAAVEIGRASCRERV